MFDALADLIGQVYTAQKRVEENHGPVAPICKTSPFWAKLLLVVVIVGVLIEVLGHRR